MTNEDSVELKIHGMDCAEEVSLLKRELLPLLGGDERLGFDLLNARLTVDLDGIDVVAGDVLAAIERTGLKAETWENARQSSKDQSFWAKHQRTIMTATSGAFGGYAAASKRFATTSASCTVFSAAPLRRLSFETNSDRPRPEGAL